MSFEQDLKNFAFKVGKKSDATIRGTLIEMGARIVERSPVGDATFWKSKPPKGYTGGYFRGNWQHGVGTLPSSQFDTIDPTGEVSTGRIGLSVAAHGAQDVHYIVNNLPYSIALENGHSRQAPIGMVGVTALEFESILKANV